MFTGEFKFDLELMRSGLYCFEKCFGWAYPYTNEPIEQWLPIAPIKGKRILTVAASGDQPLFYAANGAAAVDTFDKTINACVVMDFKTTALNMNLTYADYMYMINHLYDLSYNDLTRRPYLRTNVFNRVVNNMPERTRQIMQSFTNPKPGMVINSCCYHVAEPARTPSLELYDKMRHISHPPFTFIWADLTNVPNYIKGKYDIIYLSNIFDHYVHYSNDFQSIWKSLNSLWPHLNAGGHILFTTAASMQPKQKYKSIYNVFKFSENVLKAIPANASIKCTHDTSWSTIIIQKTR